MTFDNPAHQDAFDRAVEQTVSIVERNHPVVAATLAGTVFAELYAIVGGDHHELKRAVGEAALARLGGRMRATLN